MRKEEKLFQLKKRALFKIYEIRRLKVNKKQFLIKREKKNKKRSNFRVKFLFRFSDESSCVAKFK